MKKGDKSYAECFKKCNRYEIGQTEMEVSDTFVDKGLTDEDILKACGGRTAHK